MSRPQGHRKSQSTSALNVLASSSSKHDLSSQSRPARHRARPSGLPAVPESNGASAHMSQLPGLTDRRYSRAETEVGNKPQIRKNSEQSVVRMEDVRGWLNDVRSLRSSERRRLSALKHLEKTLVASCADEGKRPSLEDLVGAHIHDPLLALMSRHAEALAIRANSTHSSLSPGDELAALLVPELSIIVVILQGLCLLSRKAKLAVAESWVLEITIDLSLLLRAQIPKDNERPIVYNILELLCCVLVDSPTNAREFERLSGLEAVVRVLKGTGVAKDVRMKCIEFLYFYLLPEQNSPQRATSTGSTSSSSSAESTLFPPSPLSSTESDSSARMVSPSPAAHVIPSDNLAAKIHYPDIDIPFVPMTPRKPPQPNLGYLTPSTTRRVSGSTTPSLPTVPASPRVPASPSTKRLSSLAETSPDTTIVASSRKSQPARDWRRSSTADNMDAGLGFGLPSGQDGMKRSATAIRLASHAPSFTDPFASSTPTSSSSTTPTPSAAPTPITRSTTQPSLVVSDSEAKPSHRRPSSIHRGPREPPQSTTPTITVPETPQPRTPKIRHSRTQSHMSSLAAHAEEAPPLPAPTPSRGLAPPPNPSALTRSPSSKPHRAFPAALTRGLPPSTSSPALTPLGMTKRVSSGGRPSLSVDKVEKNLPHEKNKGPGVKSVEEKKKLLGMWLGNVDQLVQGVEKVSFWGSVGGKKG
ncbi:hypothetical protein M231_08095 [Tremella mesenterica]|uniref:Cell division control protein 14 n=1 Tax=Tremella mesenterica TaxID=5217 RepID=A0A4Q1BF49_TREME|nr:hypothetical protein M231_08095 [Tremella mesenterica]